MTKSYFAGVALASVYVLAGCSSKTTTTTTTTVQDASISDAVVEAASIDAGRDAAPPCKVGELCGTQCVDVQSAHDNCGTCGVVCGATQACVSGLCTGACPPTEMVCAGLCVDMQTDNGNCGMCGQTCSTGQVCSNGACATSCASNLMTCGGDAGVDAGAPYCANIQSDDANCGNCGIVCAHGYSCQSGQCVITCGGGLMVCGDIEAGPQYCANLTADNANCGACGVTCASGSACMNGSCETTCGSHETLCGVDDAGLDSGPGYCANLSIDNGNCGACGVTCDSTLVCSNGHCAASCSANYTTCGGDAGADAGAAYCVDTRTDNGNCGKCGTRCSTGYACTAGSCQPTCLDGEALCTTTSDAGVDAGTSVCANLQNDPLNCGGCGSSCASTESCSLGICCPIGSTNVGGSCLGVYASAMLPSGNKKLAFVYAPAGTAITSDSDYASFCVNRGFLQNQNGSNGQPFTSAGMYSSSNYYCNSYCCYLGPGSSQSYSLYNFQNFGLPTNTPLQVFDRGCGDYCGSFIAGVNTSDTLVVTSGSSFSYSGAGNYCNSSKSSSFASDGVVVCQLN